MFTTGRQVDASASHARNPRMTIRPLVILPDHRLREQSAPVSAVTPDLLQLAQDMLETMYDAPGIGLAAVQIGEMVRLIVLDVGQRGGGEKDPQIFFNPEVVWESEELSPYTEGCLSIPEYEEEVIRPTKVRVRFMDKAGKPAEIAADGILATCLQHEIDHINGVLFIDHISKMKRDRVTKKFKKKARLGGE